MPGWDSYRAVYGAELRAAALEFVDHGWPVVEESATSLLLITGSALDVLEVPAACGRQVCAQLRAAGAVVPVAATPTGSWWFPVATGGALLLTAKFRAPIVGSFKGHTIYAPPPPSSSEVDTGTAARSIGAACATVPPAIIAAAAAPRINLRISISRPLFRGRLSASSVSPQGALSRKPF